MNVTDVMNLVKFAAMKQFKKMTKIILRTRKIPVCSEKTSYKLIGNSFK